MKDDSTENRILSAARKVFLAKGMDGARMQDIADEAGINKALLHYYFRSKEKLFETIFKEVTAQLLPRVAEIFSSDQGLFEKIEQFVDTYISQMQKTPYLPAFVISEVNRQPEAFVRRMWPDEGPPIHLLAAQVKKEVEAGIIRPIHPFQLLMNLIALCIFPFAARPIFQIISGLPDPALDQMMEMRKKEVSQFIINAIRK